MILPCLLLMVFLDSQQDFVTVTILYLLLYLFLHRNILLESQVVLLVCWEIHCLLIEKRQLLSQCECHRFLSQVAIAYTWRKVKF